VIAKTLPRIGLAILVVSAALLLSGCPPGPGAGGRSDSADGGGRSKDPHVVRTPDNLREDPSFVSAPTLGYPIYACGSGVTVSNFIPDAKIEVFINGAPAPQPSFIGQFPTPGQTHDTGHAFVVGDVVYVTQTFQGAISAHSNAVPVSSHTDDFPNGLPTPRLFKHPLFQCGHAVLVEDVVPNSKVTIQTEDPDGSGGFKPAVDAGGFEASPTWGLNWSSVNPPFALGTRVSTTAQICADRSPRSDFEITVTPPAPMPYGVTEKPIVEGQDLVTVWGQNGPPSDPPQHGAILTVRDGASVVRGQTPTPGGAQHTMWIAPKAGANEPLTVTQTLCSESDPGPPTTVGDCRSMPAPIIKPPLPGDTKIYVVQLLPGAEILVFANGQEVGHSSGSVINLSRAINDGETIVVEQRLGKCTGRFAYEIPVACALGTAAGACSSDWPAFRQNGMRTARQVQASPLGDPYAVKKLSVWATTTAPDGGVFVASPVVFEGRVQQSAHRVVLYNPAYELR